MTHKHNFFDDGGTAGHKWALFWWQRCFCGKHRKRFIRGNSFTYWLYWKLA